MNHRWLGNHSVSLKTVGGENVDVEPAGFVDADMDDMHVKDYLNQGLLLPVAPFTQKDPKGGDK